jgi:hypothetical protein
MARCTVGDVDDAFATDRQIVRWAYYLLGSGAVSILAENEEDRGALARKREMMRP